ncbi:ATP-binding protein [Vineibacter terrae]|uniref:ATP-binding protein n=1 Tax=Vineibacter terrae TaxID=2586908 RepID=A0A5C8PK91_9HYPH|nr:ATP-binding protein [Vineibacter terrae]TXL74085.1 ATP-binding protein [Vineibacter terrae]
MDPRENPYAPGAGSPPPELAGRDDVLEQASIAVDRIGKGLHARSLILVGLRGVGKTVLLNRMRQDAEAKKAVCTRIEAPEDRSLPAMLAPALRAALVRLDRLEAAAAAGNRLLGVLAGFLKAAKIKYGDVEVGLDLDIEKGVADTGDLQTDLADLLETIGMAAKAGRTSFVLFIDELQYVREPELAALIHALHRCAQSQLPVALFGAGLPQLRGRMGEAKSYAERLFEFPQVGALDDPAARRALNVPANARGVFYEEAALADILRQTHGYPYFLQEWGKHAWTAAARTPITLADARTATSTALAELDASFFRVRFDRLTPAEKRYLRAMAELGAGPHRSGDIADMLGKKVTTLGPTRAALINKGMIYSPAHGDTAFSVPLFDGFMRRVMPVFGR